MMVLLQLLEDVEPKYICPYLVDMQILNEKEVLNICANPSPLKKLLEVIFLKGENALDALIVCLKRDDCYDWLYTVVHEKLLGDTSNKLQKSFVPYPNAWEIERPAIIDELHNALYKASHEGRHWVSLYGMVGSGKSILAAQAIRNFKYLSAFFPGGVVWLPIGQLQDNENSALLLKLQILSEQIGSHNHSDSLHVAKHFLRRKIADAKKQLLVLDDVWQAAVIDAFDLGWPVLVTTRDRSCLDNKSEFSTFVNCQNGFTWDETREIYAKRLGISQDEVGPGALKTYQKCLGLPFFVSMIGNMIEKYGNEPEGWEHVSKMLESGQMKRMRRASGEDAFNTAIEASLKTLDQDLNFYKDFMIFWEDVYIPHEVFQVVWEMERYEVMDIMEILLKKSLVQKVEDETESGIRKKIRYGIHDLYLRFLKSHYHKEKQSRHRRLINNYLELCKRRDGTLDLALFPNDGYIHTFLAYHLSKAEMFDLFPKIFLDLRFIKTKLRLSGPHDLMHDLELYKQHFSQDLCGHDDLQKFLSLNGHSLCHPEVDIIQMALNEPRSSSIFQGALKLVTQEKLTREKKYLTYCNRESNDSSLLLSTKPHSGSVHCAIFTPCNHYVISCGEDPVIKIWNSVTGKHLMQLVGHADEVNLCTISPDGLLVASASKDKTVRLWSLENFHKIAKMSLKNAGSTPEPSLCSFSFNSSLSTTPEENSAFTFKLHEASVLACSFSNDSTRVASGCEGGSLMVWMVSDGTILLNLSNPVDQLTNDAANLTSCCFSPDDRLIASSYMSSYVVIWDVKNGSKHREFFHDEQGVSSCRFHFSGLISTSGQYIWQWDVKDGTLVAKFNTLKTVYLMTCCDFTPDEKFVVAGTSERAIAIWNARTKHVHAIFKGHSESLECVSVSSDSLKLVSSCTDGTVMIWDIASDSKNLVCLMQEFSVQFSQLGIPTILAINESNQLLVMEGFEGKLVYQSDRLTEVTACALSPDCKSILFGDKQGFVKIMNYSSHEINKIGQHGSEVCSCLFVDGKDAFITVSTTGDIVLWRGNKSYGLLGHNGNVRKCLLYKDGQNLLSCSEDGSIKSWDLNSAQCLVTCAHGSQTVTSCDITSDSKHFASCSVDKTAKVWNAINGDLEYTFELTSCCRSIKFHPWDSQIAIGTDSGLIKIVSMEDGDTQDLTKHQGFVYDMVFSHDGTELVSVADEVVFWKALKATQTFGVKGKSIKSIQVSDNFKTFIIIDANGMLYIIKEINA